MGETNKPFKGKVLLTGGSGFIASHILDVLLEAGFEVVATARSDAKGHGIVEGVKPAFRSSATYSIVADVAKEGVFDTVLRSHGPFDYVIHTASPYHNNVQDPVKDFLDPAIKGTTGLLKSIRENAPTVMRVVFLSSSAAILNPGNHAKVYDETYWAPMTWEEAMVPKNTYRASKIFSEEAAWNFISHEKPSFDLATINCTFNFGPIQRALPHLDNINTSNQRIRDMVLGRMKFGLEPTAPVFTFVDVRDVAEAHLVAMLLPEAGGERFYVVGGYFSNKRIVDIIREKFPELGDRLPGGGEGLGSEDLKDDFPEDVYGFDNSKSRRMLGLKYRGLERVVVDTVQSMLNREGGLEYDF
ncbi:uncharacterized protein BCR38DRAFT_486769 [Pseudomassariella vexata]|uniref:NAD-dependent epimerase/dehydratase domain-containing protein n=1 Tax=Pseudomassariella vexata TaxID=1141098 RepID=A0A1Y2DTA6_9PEZI|nr:uncharacterized protein BCR38DRAFT_486769 [Pseudomassariella vexata]ORY62500.1 hypothetical protein BCR38DRAFT_486769 [Pseudomassariella vexata]